MLKENKCALCKHFMFDGSWIRKCKAYPNGIPDDIFNDNSVSKDCKSQICNFEYKPDND